MSVFYICIYSCPENSFIYIIFLLFLRWLSGKESTCNSGDLGFIPGSGRSPGERNGNLLKYSCLGNPMSRGAWWATANGVTKRVGRDLVTKQQYHFSRFHIYVLIYNICFFFLISSLCMADSRSIHISTNDPTLFLFMAE